MPLDDYLMPNENIRYQSDFDIKYGGKSYTVVLTDIRLILYARRGLFTLSDDVVTETIRDIKGIKYKEGGVLFKSARLEVLSKSKIVLRGSKAEIKTLYQRMLPFLTLHPKPPPIFYTPTPLSPDYSTSAGQRTSHSFRYCPDCGIELPPNSRFCFNCGKPLS